MSVVKDADRVATPSIAGASDDGLITGTHVEAPEAQAVQSYAYDESRKIGVTGAVFLILNKMIGTGSMLLSGDHSISFR
jgi:hypothetical protein